MLTLNELKSSKIGIVGFGAENKQFVTWLLNVVRVNKDQIVIFDQKKVVVPNPEIKLVWGSNYLEELVKTTDLDTVFKSPGIWSLKPEFEELRKLRGQDFIQSSFVYFISKFSQQIIGITGTKGKSTTANFLFQMLNSNLGLKTDKKPTAVYCGNTTGVSPYQFWTNFDQEIDKNQFFVIELSSFQLQDLGYGLVGPKYAVLTNLMLDHLDQHATSQEYWQAKENIFAQIPKGEKYNGLVVATEQVLENSPELVKIVSLDNTLILNEIQYGNILDQEILDLLKSNQILGGHNRTNLLLAYLMSVAVLFNLSNKAKVLQKALENKMELKKLIPSLTMLEKRLELIKTLEDKDKKLTINFFDDGAGTHCGAVEAGVKAVMESRGSLLWLQMSGTDKGSDCAGLVSTLVDLIKESRVYKLDFFGQIGERVLFRLIQTGVDLSPVIINTGKMRDFLKNGFDFESISNKQTGTTLQVLFSPGGSSFDEFENYNQRSRLWKEVVNKVDML